MYSRCFRDGDGWVCVMTNGVTSSIAVISDDEIPGSVSGFGDRLKGFGKTLAETKALRAVARVSLRAAALWPTLGPQASEMLMSTADKLDEESQDEPGEDVALVAERPETAEDAYGHLMTAQRALELTEGCYGGYPEVT